MTFKPGVSGNPNGRPKGELSKATVLARGYTEQAINTLVEIMQKDSAPESSRVTAANSLLDRAWGKPVAGDENAAGLEALAQLIINR